MKSNFFPTALSLLFAVTASLTPVIAFASPQVVHIETNEVISTAEGFVIGPDTLQKFKASKIEQIASNRFRVHFDTGGEAVGARNTFLSGWGFTEKGSIVFADVREPEPINMDLKSCKPTVINTKASGGHLFSLLEIRGARREILREQLTLNLNRSDQKELRNLEQLFGLNQAEMINPDMNPFELLDRLYRLEAALGRLE